MLGTESGAGSGQILGVDGDRTGGTVSRYLEGWRAPIHIAHLASAFDRESGSRDWVALFSDGSKGRAIAT